MKLAFCLFKYFPYGGLQRDFLRIAEACHRRGHEIHVYTMRWEGDSNPEFHLHIIDAQGWQNHTRGREFAAKLTAELRAQQYDLVIGFNKLPNLDFYYAADVCYQARASQQHGWWYRLLPRYRQQVALEAAVFAHGNNTQIMLISPRQQAAFTQYYQTETERFHLLPPGIAKDRLPPPNAAAIRQSLRHAYHLTDNDVMLLMVGSGFKTKGLDRAIAALAALPANDKMHTHLFVIGQDNPKQFATLAGKLDVAAQVHFLGGRPDVPDFLLAADVLVHPAYHENTGTVLLEAMIAGLPVLTVDVCGYAHYVHDYDAGKVLTSPFQQSQLNAALQEMLHSPQRRVWQANGIAFGKNADIYSLPERAADIIEGHYKDKYIKQHAAAIFLSFDEAMALQGEIFRDVDGRVTQRVLINGNSYFIKQHHGVGWKEIIKNMLQLRFPVLGAQNEWRAINKLQKRQVATPTVVACGQRGLNPASMQSYILMEELKPVISLEDLSRDWQTSAPTFAFKRILIEEVARIARVLHESGMNHRDFYICHFLLDLTPGLAHVTAANLKLYLIDLHRAQIRRLTPKRWIIKDLAGLYFSSKNIGLTQRDWYRFMCVYRQKSLRDIIQREKPFWQKVKMRGEQLYRDHT